MRRPVLFLASALLGFTLTCGLSARAESAFGSSAGLVTVQGSPMPLPLYLDALGRQSGRSVVVLPGVSSDPVGYQFVRVPWRVAWDSVVAAHGLVSCVGAEVVAVGPAGSALTGVCGAVGGALPVPPADPAASVASPGLSAAAAVRAAVAPGSPAPVPSPVASPPAPIRYAVRVRLLEVADNASSAGGVDWSRGLLGTVANIAIGAAAGFTPSVSSLDLSRTISALEQQGLARKLDDVQLQLTQDRSTSFQSGGTLQLSLVGGSQAIERTYQYGLTLDMIPTETSEGVALALRADLASPVSTSNPALLDMSRRSLNSDVLLRPGAPVVAASFASLRDEVSGAGLPGLARLPAVGYLAGQASSTAVRSTVVVLVELL